MKPIRIASPFVAEALVEVQRVPGVVRPDADPALTQSGRHLGRRGALDVDQEGRHTALERRQAVDGDAVRQLVEEAFAERALGGNDRVHAADLTEVVDRGVETGEQLVGQRAGLEAPAERTRRRRPGLVGTPAFEQRGAPVGDAEVRAAELVGRAEQHVGPDRRDVDRLVRGVVDRVDPGQRADAVRQLADPRGVDDRADRVGRPGEGHDPRALGELGREVVVVERRVGAQLDVLDAHVLVVGELEPRRHATVVVERGDEDLVAGDELAAGGAREGDRARLCSARRSPHWARSRGTRLPSTPPR